MLKLFLSQMRLAILKKIIDKRAFPGKVTLSGFSSFQKKSLNDRLTQALLFNG